MKTITFPGVRSGTDTLFNDPYWVSECKQYRILKTNCVRPYRLFRRIKKHGFPWIGVDSGFNSRDAAITAANVHANMKKEKRKSLRDKIEEVL